MMMSEKQFPDSQNMELDLLLDTLYRFYNLDLRQYSRPSLLRLVQNLLAEKGMQHISELVPWIIHEPQKRHDLIDHLTVSYSSLFRDPESFKRLRIEVFDYLRSFPDITIWVAGCAEGEEAYSLGILLDEASLLDKTQIYATDISSSALQRGSRGVHRRPLDTAMQKRYVASGGSKKLCEYFPSNRQGEAQLVQRILKHIHFVRQDLVQQSLHNTAQLILCRNVFIYFEHDLKDKVLEKFVQTLSKTGYLAIGLEEDISQCQSYAKLDIVSRKAGLFRLSGKPQVIQTKMANP